MPVSSEPKGKQLKNKITGVLLATMVIAGGLGVTACSSDDSNSGSSSVADQAQEAQNKIDDATQQGKEAIDQGSQAVNEAKDAINSVQGGN